MQIRHANRNDFPTILPIYEQARRFMALTGNPNQWINGYPSQKQLKEDLAENRLYVCCEADKIAMVFVFFIGIDPNYRIIEDGCWPDDRPYGTIHRIASAQSVPHASDFVVSWCSEQCRQAGASLRGDTHEKNLPMQRVFIRNGFVKCGIVHMADGSPRFAYQKETSL